MPRHRLFLNKAWLFVVGLTIHLGADAYADTSACDRHVACRQYLDQALELDRAQKYEQALSAFRAAYGQRPHPRLAVNIGRTCHKLGRFAEALTWYREAGRAGASDAVLQQELRGFVADAKVALDGSPPPPLVLRPNIQVTTPPHSIPTLQNEVDVQLGQSVLNTNNISLQMLPSAARADRKPLHRQPCFWATVGVGTAAVATGLAVAFWPRPWQPEPSLPSYPVFTLASLRGGS